MTYKTLNFVWWAVLRYILAELRKATGFWVSLLTGAGVSADLLTSLMHKPYQLNPRYPLGRSVLSALGNNGLCQHVAQGDLHHWCEFSSFGECGPDKVEAVKL